MAAPMCMNMAAVVRCKFASSVVGSGFTGSLLNPALVKGVLRRHVVPTLQQHVKYRVQTGLKHTRRWPGMIRQSIALLHTSRQALFRHGQKKASSLVPAEAAEQTGEAIGMRDLLKPFIFTVTFSAGSFAVAAIWQYENIREGAFQAFHKPQQWLQNRFQQHQKQGEWRDFLNNWWNNLPDGQRVFIPICLLNVLVYIGWRFPRFHPFMIRYFTSCPTSKSKCLPMVLSTFSHYSALHLMANMYVLQSFSTGVVYILGTEQFVGMYLSAGVISSFTSYLHKVSTARYGMSLGASGAIMAVVAMVCTQFPDAKLAIIFLPMLTFSAGMAIKGLIAMDTAGVVMGWRFFDHAAHLGGALFGMMWCYWGSRYLWQEREPLLRWWHNLRGSKEN